MNWLLGIALLLIPGLAWAEDVAAPRKQTEVEIQGAEKRGQYQALLRDAMAKAAVAKAQADAERLQRQKSQQ